MSNLDTKKEDVLIQENIEKENNIINTEKTNQKQDDNEFKIEKKEEIFSNYIRGFDEEFSKKQQEILLKEEQKQEGVNTQNQIKINKKTKYIYYTTGFFACIAIAFGAFNIQFLKTSVTDINNIGFDSNKKQIIKQETPKEQKGNIINNTVDLVNINETEIIDIIEDNGYSGQEIDNFEVKEEVKNILLKKYR